MDWFYTPMVDWHAYFGWTSAILFLGRGLIHQLGRPWADRFAKDSRLLVLAFGINTLLAVTGLSIWVSMHYDLLRNPWLLVKLMAMAGYFASAHWSMGEGRFHQAGYVIALLLLILIMVLSYTRQVF